MHYAELYKKFAEESYQNSFDHGFWEEGEATNKGKLVMLMISELTEAMEADRKDHHFYPNASRDYTRWCFDARFSVPSPAKMSDDELFKSWFEAIVKHTVEDEMADVAIRIMNFIYGWRCIFREKCVIDPEEISLDFAEAMLELTEIVILAHNRSRQYADWSYALCAVVSFCESRKIDLAGHIQMKQRYNRMREIRHGKKY